MGVIELNLALVDSELYDVISQRMSTMITAKDSILDLQFVIVEELLEKACLRVLVELGADEATTTVARTCLTRCIDRDLLL